MNRDILGKANFIGFSTVTTAAVIWGWSQRDEYWINAEQGLGYYLGIIGASMMALLLLYPLRKKLRALRSILPVRYWFKMHMVFGILGPVLILFHSNFSLGSTNSNVALFCMLLVVFSGLFARIIYRHTHNGLYGKKLQYAELRAKYGEIKETIDEKAFSPEILQLLQSVEDLASSQTPSRLTPLAESFQSVLKARSLSIRLNRELRRSREFHLQTTGGHQFIFHELSQHLKQETAILRKIVGLSYYNRIFSLWHIAHLPIFLMMVLTAIVHIFVVHMY